ncbi:MAG: hypothetical protein N2111_01730 [Candidatus Sumerlaeaceae bacterium]|nr:hypothetical protein [Candidatus Sumerlaeaceae bacterium]
MAKRVMRLALLLGVVATAACGCRGCIRENVVYEHTFNRPDCRMKVVTPPREYPEFELPPGGPYLNTPVPARAYK